MKARDSAQLEANFDFLRSHIVNFPQWVRIVGVLVQSRNAAHVCLVILGAEESCLTALIPSCRLRPRVLE
jgi:hypothetical protein